MLRRIIILLLIAENIFAQNHLINARSMAMAGAGAAYSPESGLPENIACLANQKKSFFEAGSANLYSVKELTIFNAVFGGKINSNNSALIAISKTGTSVYTEQFLEIDISKKLSDKLFASAGSKYYEWRAVDSHYSKIHSLIPQICLYVQALPSLSFGVTVRDPVRSRMNAIEPERMPAEVESGFSAKISRRLMLCMSVSGSTGSPASVRSGFEYAYAKTLKIYAGYKTFPAAETFGFEVSPGKYQLSAGVENHPALGLSSAITFVFQL